jgi:hypothetical protein
MAIVCDGIDNDKDEESAAVHGLRGASSTDQDSEHDLDLLVIAATLCVGYGHNAWWEIQ